MTNAQAGKLIALVGANGVGKSTLIEPLASILEEKHGFPVYTIKYPQYDGTYGKEISAYLSGQANATPFQFQSWCTQNRKAAEPLIRKLVHEGYIVLTEGYWIDTLVRGFLSEVHWRELRPLIKQAEFIQPDLTIVLDPKGAKPIGEPEHLHELNAMALARAMKLYRRLGKAFGFDSLDVTQPDGNFLHKQILVNELQRRILKLYA